MKAPIVLPVLSWLACTASLRADQPRWNVVAECQMVTLPQKAALALLPELNEDAKIEAAFAKLQAMIERKEATLVAALIAKATDGERAVVESMEEKRYASAYAPPQLPPPTAADKPDLLKAWPLVGITPTDFESRNLGVTLEVEPKVLEGGRVLSVNVVPIHARLLRWERFEAGKLPNGEHLAIEQPQFGVAKDNCTLLLRNGQRVLLGVHKVPDAADTLELFLFKVTATPAP